MKFIVFLIKMVLELYLRILGSILRLLNEYYILYDTMIGTNNLQKFVMFACFFKKNAVI